MAYEGSKVAPSRLPLSTASAVGGVTGGSGVLETPSGTINGVNQTFTITNTPIANSFKLFQNGWLLTGGGVHYTLSGTTITYVSGFQPVSGENHTADYRK